VYLLFFSKSVMLDLQIQQEETGALAAAFARAVSNA
jgi:hypothetical protein